MDRNNLASYYGLVKKHTSSEAIREFDWRIYELLEVNKGGMPLPLFISLFFTPQSV